MTQKVFCIGFPKTGTSSLAVALTTLGYSVCRRLPMLQNKLPSVDLIEQLKNKDYTKILTATKDFDAFCDNPWLLMYKEIEKKNPDCKFILTVRDENKWLTSVLNYFGNSTSEIREIIFGKSCPINNETLYLEKYKQHNKEVKNYLKSQPSRLLVLHIDAENKFQKLSEFLGKEKQDTPYPHENSTSISLYGTVKKVTGKRFATVFKLPFHQKKLYSEAFIFLTISRVLILFFPFKKLAKRIGTLGQESTSNITVQQQLIGIEIGRVIKKISLYTPFRSLCFEQALTCKLMLNRKKISSTIYFGLAKSETAEATNLKAHAWLRSGEKILTGNKGKDKFKMLALFGN